MSTLPYPWTGIFILFKEFETHFETVKCYQNYRTIQGAIKLTSKYLRHVEVYSADIFTRLSKDNFLSQNGDLRMSTRKQLFILLVAECAVPSCLQPNSIQQQDSNAGLWMLSLSLALSVSCNINRFQPITSFDRKASP